MGILMFVYKESGDLIYLIFKIMAKEQWMPFHHRFVNRDSIVSSVYTPEFFAAAEALVKSDISDFCIGRV